MCGCGTPSPLPACSGSRWVRHQLPHQLVVHQLVCPSWPTPDLNPRVLTPADVESCEAQRFPLSCQWGERCLSVISPTTNHNPSCFPTSPAGASDLSTWPVQRKVAQVIRRVFRTVVHTPSFHRLIQFGNDSAQQIKTQSASHLLNGLYYSLGCSTWALAIQKWGSWCCGCQQCACVVDDCHECVLRVSLDDHFGMSDVSCEFGQTATCKRISVFFLLKRNGNHLFIHCVYGHQDCDHWSILLCLQEAEVALDDGCAWLFLWSWHMSVFFPASSDTDVAECVSQRCLRS